MATSWRALLAAVAVLLAIGFQLLTVLTFASVAFAAPPGKVDECSHVEYRTKHLDECNLQQSPFLLGGGGGSCGAVCHVLRGIPGLGRLF